MHRGTTFRALKLTYQVVTEGAESAACDCLVFSWFSHYCSCVCVCVCGVSDFAYVSADESRGGIYTCHVFRSDTAACQISDSLLAVITHSLHDPAAAVHSQNAVSMNVTIGNESKCCGPPCPNGSAAIDASEIYWNSAQSFCQSIQKNSV